MIFTVSENKKKVSKYILRFFFFTFFSKSWKSRIFSKINISPLTQDYQIKKSIFNKYERRWNIINSLKYYNKIQAPSSERTRTCQTCVSGVYILSKQVSILMIWIYLKFFMWPWLIHSSLNANAWSITFVNVIIQMYTKWKSNEFVFFNWRNCQHLPHAYMYFA